METKTEKELREEVIKVLKLCDRYAAILKRSLNFNRKLLNESKIDFWVYLILGILWFILGILIGWSM